jgi:hypothetical protein
VWANGSPNPRHLPLRVYLAPVRRAAVRGTRSNGVSVSGADVSFPGSGFAPTRVAVAVRGVVRVRRRLEEGGRRGRRASIPVRARAAAEIAPDVGAAFGMPSFGSGGGYNGPWCTGWAAHASFVFRAVGPRFDAARQLHAGEVRSAGRNPRRGFLPSTGGISSCAPAARAEAVGRRGGWGATARRLYESGLGVIHEGAGRVKGRSRASGGRASRWRDGRGVGGSGPVIHSAALGGPECRAVLEGSIKFAAVVRLVGRGEAIDNTRARSSDRGSPRVWGRRQLRGGS